MNVKLFYFADEIIVTSSHDFKMKKNYKRQSKLKKNKGTKSGKKDKKTKVKKHIEKDEVLRPKSTKFYHRLLNIFCCCCGKTE